MKTLRIATLLLFSFSLSFLACESPSSNNEVKDVKEEAKELSEEVGEVIKVEQKELRNRLETMGENIDQKVEGLEAKLDEASEDMKVTYQEQIKNLKTQREKLDERLDKINKNTTEGWKEFKEKTAGVIDDVQNELDEISS